MKKVLVISPNYYPLSGIGSVRAKALVKFLIHQEYDVTVVTVSDDYYKRDGLRMDEKINPFFEYEVEMIIIPIARVPKLESIFKSIRLFRVLWMLRYDLYWDRYSGWLKEAKQSHKVNDAAKQSDAILCIAAPFSSILLGVFLKKKYRKKLVVDLRDPFLEHFGWKWPTYFHWLVCKWKEPQFLKNIDELVVVTHEMKNIYQEKRGIKEKNIHVITNGYE